MNQIQARISLVLLVVFVLVGIPILAMGWTTTLEFWLIIGGAVAVIGVAFLFIALVIWLAEKAGWLPS